LRASSLSTVTNLEAGQKVITPTAPTIGYIACYVPFFALVFTIGQVAKSFLEVFQSRPP
jgi:hypothetical protein